MHARDFWRDGQNHYFGVKVSITNTQPQSHTPNERTFIKHEKEKKRHYNTWIMNIEHNTFTTLVFHVNRSMNRECSTFHKYFAEKIAEKSACRYEKVMSVINFDSACFPICKRGSNSLKKYSRSQCLMIVKLHLTMHWLQGLSGKGFRIQREIRKNTRENSKVVCIFCYFCFHFSNTAIYLTLVYFDSFCPWFLFLY